MIFLKYVVRGYVFTLIQYLVLYIIFNTAMNTELIG